MSRLQPTQRTRGGREAVLVRELEVKLKPRAHVRVQLEAEVVVQVRAQLRARQAECALVLDDDLLRVREIDFAGARDEGLKRVEEIAAEYARELNRPSAELVRYLRENICFELDEEMRAGLELFFRLAHKHGVTRELRPLRWLGA